MRVESIRLETTMQEVSGVPVIKTSGEIDVYTAPEFKTAINSVIDNGHKDLIIDLTEIDYMDSGGFGTLLGAIKRIRTEGGGIALLNCSDAIVRMLMITRLDDLFPVYNNLDDAVNDIKAKKKKSE